MSETTQLPAGQPQELEQLVEYAPGAIVSRTLVKSSVGSVTLFAFEAGQELSEHTAPFDALVQVVDGEGLFVVGGVESRCAAGPLPMELHSLWSRVPVTPGASVRVPTICQADCTTPGAPPRSLAV